MRKKPFNAQDTLATLEANDQPQYFEVFYVLIPTGADIKQQSSPSYSNSWFNKMCKHDALMQFPNRVRTCFLEFLKATSFGERFPSGISPTSQDPLSAEQTKNERSSNNGPKKNFITQTPERKQKRREGKICQK